MPNNLKQGLKRNQVQEWLVSPITLAFAKLIKDHLDAHKEALSETVLYCKSFDESKESLLHLRGQVHALNTILDLEAFLDEVILDENLSTDQIQLHSEDN